MSTAKFIVGKTYGVFHFDTTPNTNKPEYLVTKRSKRVVFLQYIPTGFKRAYPITISKVTGHEMVQFIGGPTVFANQ